MPCYLTGALWPVLSKAMQVSVFCVEQVYVMYDTCNVLKFRVKQIYIMYDTCNVLKFL